MPRSADLQVLEARCLLTTIQLDELSIDSHTGEKPQSKAWQHDGHWWTVLTDREGAWLWQLQDDQWERTLQLSEDDNFEADIRAEHHLAHVLLFDGEDSQYVTLAYSTAEATYAPWSEHPEPIAVELSSAAETATIEVDTQGRLWVAADASSDVEVRYSDAPYTVWSDPIVLADDITSDDISAIAALPNGLIGVVWSDQNSERFGFRYHVDGTAAEDWSQLEIPADHSALEVGNGMADDHLNVAVGTDGTLYVAVKTSYDRSGYPKLGLLVRRPDGSWDSLYQFDTGGTRPIVVLDEVQRRVLVAFTTSEGGGNIVFRESPLDAIDFGPRQTLLSGNYNNVTSVKHADGPEIVFLASTSSKIASAMVVADLAYGSAQVVGHHLFYNQSQFDGFDPAATPADDAAIAPGKRPLFAGDEPTADNYSTYMRGLNGLMVDILDLGSPAQLELSDFRFRVGRQTDGQPWSAAPPPGEITVREGAGMNGSDRVTIIWDDHLIANTWLEVQVLPTPHTLLGHTEVFYFGSLPGDVGGSAWPAMVNATDLALLRHALTGAGEVAIDSAFDLNRDGLIDHYDVQATATSLTSLASSLTPLFGAESASQSASASLVSEGEALQSPDTAAVYQAIAFESQRRARRVALPRDSSLVRSKALDPQSLDQLFALRQAAGNESFVR
jgi:hypothetical protein